MREIKPSFLSFYNNPSLRQAAPIASAHHRWTRDGGIRGDRRPPRAMAVAATNALSGRSDAAQPLNEAQVLAVVQQAVDDRRAVGGNGAVQGDPHGGEAVVDQAGIATTAGCKRAIHSLWVPTSDARKSSSGCLKALIP